MALPAAWPLLQDDPAAWLGSQLALCLAVRPMALVFRIYQSEVKRMTRVADLEEVEPQKFVLLTPQTGPCRRLSALGPFSIFSPQAPCQHLDLQVKDSL